MHRFVFAVHMDAFRHSNYCRCLRKLTGTALLPRPNASPAEASALASNNELVVVSHGLACDSPEGPLFNFASQVLEVFIFIT